MESLYEKVIELNGRLVDLAEKTNIHILVNITIVEWEMYSRTTGISEWFPQDQLLYAALGQSENIYKIIQK